MVAYSNPFSQAFLSKFGEEAAKQVIEFLVWIKGKVVQAVQRHRSKRVLLEFVVENRGCKVEFVIDSKEPEILLPAIDSLQSAGRSALALVDRLAELEPDKLVYEFDRKTGQWLPLHAATRKRGVIVDRPVLIALDRYRSFSIGGSVTQRRLEDKSDPSPQ